MGDFGHSHSDLTQHILKILVVHCADGDNPVGVSIPLEGKEILLGCSRSVNACIMCMWLIYVLNTFEVFQKLFLGLDGIKWSPKYKLSN